VNVSGVFSSADVLPHQGGCDVFSGATVLLRRQVIGVYEHVFVQADCIHYVCGFRYADDNLVYRPAVYNSGNLSCHMEVCVGEGLCMATPFF
jgi:hypothetical protein